MDALEMSIWALKLRPYLPSLECEAHSSEGVRLSLEKQGWKQRLGSEASPLKVHPADERQTWSNIVREAGEGAGLEPNFYFCGHGSSMVIDGKERRGHQKHTSFSPGCSDLRAMGPGGKGRRENVHIKAY